MDINTTLNILSTICDIALVLVAIYGLKQLKVSTDQLTESKKARNLSAKRDAYKIAAEQCNYYMKDVIPNINILNSLIDKHQIQFFKNSKVSLEKDSVKVIPFYKKEDFGKLMIKEVGEATLTAFNNLEAFSTFFVSGVAAEEIGYDTIGYSFVTSVKGFMPLIAQLHEEKAYKNIIQLYIIWASRVEKEKLLKQKAYVEDKLNKQAVITINSLGVDKDE